MWSREIDELGMLNQTQKGANCSRIFKLVLFVTMGTILAGGIAILTIGIWTHEVEYGSKTVSGLIGYALYQVDSLMMIALGSITIFIMVIGMLGAWLKERCLLGVHLSIMTFVAFGLFAAGILGYVFVSSLEDTVRGSLKKSVTEKYGLPGFEEITGQWDSIQQRFECCGAYGNENTTTSWALYREESFWIKDNLSNHSLVPESCCVHNKHSNIEMCTGRMNTTIADDWPPYKEPPVVAQPQNYTLFTVGCYDKLESFLQQNGLMIGTCAVVVAVFMIVEIVMTILVYRRLPSR